VPLDKEGPVHEAAWSPNSEEFVVVYGFMPAKATIYTASKCEPKYQLGAGPHNTVRWNPFGRFICLAGFGNLPGDIKFFDRKADGKYKLVGSTRAACSVSIFPVSLSETSHFLKEANLSHMMTRLYFLLGTLRNGYCGMVSRWPKATDCNHGPAFEC
jgi:uncharacterized protein with WD repeat